MIINNRIDVNANISEGSKNKGDNTSFSIEGTYIFTTNDTPAQKLYYIQPIFDTVPLNMAISSSIGGFDIK